MKLMQAYKDIGDSKQEVTNLLVSSIHTIGVCGRCCFEVLG